jgi:N-acetylmuramoyl-L-alanine amidase
MREINRIILHCSDSDFAHHDDISVIRKWHVDERGWSDVGYHYFIKKDGTIQNGRPIEKVGAHAKPWNTGSIGICLGGKYEFSDEQFMALGDLVCGLIFRFNVKDENIIGHCDVPGSGKTCPNFDVEDFKERYL